MGAEAKLAQLGLELPEPLRVPEGFVGSGTGGLAGVTGTWKSILQDHNDGTTDGRYSGFLTCSAPPTRH